MSCQGCNTGCGQCCPGKGPHYPGQQSTSGVTTHKPPPSCVGVIGAEASVATTATATIAVQPTNYSSFQPQVIRGAGVDPLIASAVPNSGGLVTITSIRAVTKELIGSASINLSAIDCYAQRGVNFGADAPQMTSSNNINFDVTNNHAAAMRISFVVAGPANF